MRKVLSAHVTCALLSHVHYCSVLCNRPLKLFEVQAVARVAANALPRSMSCCYRCVQIMLLFVTLTAGRLPGADSAAGLQARAGAAAGQHAAVRFEK
jgi:hypothetical protein